MKFPKAFWRNKIGNADYFGHVPGAMEERGLFSVFYDVSRDVSIDFDWLIDYWLIDDWLMIDWLIDWFIVDNQSNKVVVVPIGD